MTGMFRSARTSSVVLIAVVFISTSNLQARQNEIDSALVPPVERLALLNDVSSAAPVPAKVASQPKGNEPVPFSISTMADDLVPPFPVHPELNSVQPAARAEVSFEENMPVESKDDSVENCCKQLTEMIAGNLESDISLEAKTMMIETALKMVAQNIELKAEAKITKLKAEHALEMSRMQSQLSQMRTVGSAANQINRVAGPLSQMLQRNYQQSVAMNLANQRMSQTLAEIGYQRLDEQVQTAKEKRQRIRLSSPSSTVSDYQWRIAQLTEQNARLEQQIDRQMQHPASAVQRAGYSQPLQPRRQPLEPLPSCPHCRNGECGHAPMLPRQSAREDVQYFQRGPEFKLSREARKEVRSAGR